MYGILIVNSGTNQQTIKLFYCLVIGTQVDFSNIKAKVSNLKKLFTAELMLVKLAEYRRTSLEIGLETEPTTESGTREIRWQTLTMIRTKVFQLTAAKVSLSDVLALTLSIIEGGKRLRRPGCCGERETVTSRYPSWWTMSAQRGYYSLESC